MMTLPQERLIARVAEKCRADERIVAALTYGSFVQGTADAHSDIEFWLFFDTVPSPRAWLDGVAPIRHVVVNEFGSHVVFFPGLIRGEFHFATHGDITSVATWPARSGPVERMIVADRTGELRRALEALPSSPALSSAPDLCGRFANWLTLAHHVTLRGELLRAADALAHARRHLLWMARLAENRTQHWLTPSRNAENDLPGSVVTVFHQATTVEAVWSAGRRYCLGVLPDALIKDLDAAVSDSDAYSP